MTFTCAHNAVISFDLGYSTLDLTDSQCKQKETYTLNVNNVTYKPILFPIQKSLIQFSGLGFTVAFTNFFGKHPGKQNPKVSTIHMLL